MKNSYFIYAGLFYFTFISTLTAQQQQTEIKNETNIEQQEQQKQQEPQEQVYKTQDVVVTGTRTRKLLKDTPVKTELIRSEDIEAKGAVSLLDALEFETGIKVDNVCSICNTTGVQISGIPSRYSLVMIDGMPVFSSLGGVYGFLNLPAADIAQVEVVKGPSSVLYGTDAIGGVINIITKEPGKDPKGVLQIEGGDFHYKHLLGYSSFSKDKLGLSLMATHTGHDSVDRDGDHVSEYTGYGRTTVTGIGRLQLTSASKLITRLSVLQENRQGGGLGWYNSIIDVLNTEKRDFSETILSRRVEGTMKYIHELNGGHVVDTSVALTYHQQDSDYEGEVYIGEQFMLYAQQNALLKLHNRYELAIGASYRLEQLEENLAISEYTYHMPGVYAQGDWSIADPLEFVHGFRFDWHNEFGPVFTPRVVLKYAANDWLTFRGMFGTGFRAPTTFYEYAHGVRQTGAHYIMDDVDPEKSMGGNLSATLDFGRILNITIEGAMNVISDPISWEVSDDGDIVVDNIAEELRVISSEVQVQSTPLRWLNISVGYGFYNYDDPNGALTSAAPVHQITGGLNVWFKDIGFKGTLSAQVYSPMDLEAVYGTGYNAVPGTTLVGWLDESNADINNPKRSKSPWYGIVDVRLEQAIWKSLSLYIGIDNILDYHQSDEEGPLYYPADDNGTPTAADVVYIWGPMRGRFFYGGLKLEV